ncbi:MAG: ribonuclease PH [Paenibacillaceae bacterium]|nr:ribonuclease PH [Paenibacillaceae bacterium]
MRTDGRSVYEMRSLDIVVDPLSYAEGAVRVLWGRTHVLCTASVETRVPSFLRHKESGWIHAEYGMLPRATHERTVREVTRGRISGRSAEIQRLIARTLRAVTDLRALGQRSIIIDCDVLQADGGTRAASIVGAVAALVLALERLMARRIVTQPPLRSLIGAVGIGVIAKELCLDMTYEEDCMAEGDFSIVMTEAGELIELQGTAERAPMQATRVHEMLAVAAAAVQSVCAVQRSVLGDALRVVQD